MMFAGWIGLSTFLGADMSMFGQTSWIQSLKSLAAPVLSLIPGFESQPKPEQPASSEVAAPLTPVTTPAAAPTETPPPFPITSVSAEPPVEAKPEPAPEAAPT